MLQTKVSSSDICCTKRINADINLKPAWHNHPLTSDIIKTHHLVIPLAFCINSDNRKNVEKVQISSILTHSCTKCNLQRKPFLLISPSKPVQNGKMCILIESSHLVWNFQRIKAQKSFSTFIKGIDGIYENLNSLSIHSSNDCTFLVSSVEIYQVPDPGI